MPIICVETPNAEEDLRILQRLYSEALTGDDFGDFATKTIKDAVKLIKLDNLRSVLLYQLENLNEQQAISAPGWELPVAAARFADSYSFG